MQGDLTGISPSTREFGKIPCAKLPVPQHHIPKNLRKILLGGQQSTELAQNLKAGFKSSCPCQPSWSLYLPILQRLVRISGCSRENPNLYLGATGDIYVQKHFLGSKTKDFWIYGWFSFAHFHPMMEENLLYLSGPHKLRKINLQRPCCSSLGSFSWKKRWEVGKALTWKWINRILSFFGWIWAAWRGSKLTPQPRGAHTGCSLHQPLITWLKQNQDADKTRTNCPRNNQNSGPTGLTAQGTDKTRTNCPKNNQNSGSQD